MDIMRLKGTNIKWNSIQLKKHLLHLGSCSCYGTRDTALTRASLNPTKPKKKNEKKKKHCDDDNNL